VICPRAGSVAMVLRRRGGLKLRAICRLPVERMARFDFSFFSWSNCKSKPSRSIAVLPELFEMQKEATLRKKL